MPVVDVLVVGIGNRYRRDDGFGCEVAASLIGESDGVEGGLEVHDLGSDVFPLIDYLRERARVVIVDAVRMGGQPGSLRVFRPNDAEIRLRGDAASTHGFGLAEALRMAAELGASAEILVIGLEPAELGLGEGLSPAAEARVTEAAELVRDLVSDASRWTGPTQGAD